MYRDTELRLATSEAVPNAGAAPGGLGEDLTASGGFIPAGGISTLLQGAADVGGGRTPFLNFDVVTAFTCATFGATLEFQLVSLPIEASLLDNGSGGAADGKLLSIASVVLDIADADPDLADTAVIVGHGLPLGTPVYLTSLATTTGVANDTIYYAVPTTADRFKLAASLANALATPAVTIDLLTGNGTATVNFIPTIHASSGGIPIYDAPANSGRLSDTDYGFQVALDPIARGPGLSVVPTVKAAVAVAGQNREPVPAGPEATLVGATPQEYFYMRYIPSATITAGAVTVDLVIDGSNARNYPATAYEVI